MVSSFYKKHARTLLWAVALTFPLLAIEAESMPSNNNIETWLPRDAQVRRTYDAFKRDFGADETILVALPANEANRQLSNAVAARLEALPGIRHCWSVDRLRSAMQELKVSEPEIDRRLRGFLISEDGKTVGLVAVLSKQGLQDRLQTVRDIRQQLSYCQLDGESIAIAGSPVVVAELDRLGSTKNNHKFFLITLLICLLLLYHSLRDWKLTATILGITLWSINLTKTIVKYSGGEMNFILGALAVMVMVFTLAICVHFIHYYQAASNEDDPLGTALKRAWKPCGLATLTTTIGLLSLIVSDIGAVQGFGIAASIGSVVALISGLGLMPAVLTVMPPKAAIEKPKGEWFPRLAHWILDHKWQVTTVTGLLVAFTAIGLWRLESRIEPLDFLPRDNRVLRDVQIVEDELAKMNSIEAIVDFGDDDSAFLTKLERVRNLEAKIASHPCVFQTTSPATFFPAKLPDSPMEAADLLQTAQKRWSGENDYIADGDRLWRISARIPAQPDRPRQQIIDELEELTAGNNITYTGISPLLEEAQTAIFTGFWESFVTAFGIISVVMIVSLRSLKAGLVAMIPNLTPICVVFGILGWYDFPVDIGMMMTGSIALGIAVDGTFHFLVSYESNYRDGHDSPSASRLALLQTGAPIFKAAVITALGMLALTLSNFVPTARFGYMMAMLMLAALLGDLVLLPAILALRPGKKTVAEPEPNEGQPSEPTIPAPHIALVPQHAKKQQLQD